MNNKWTLALSALLLASSCKNSEEVEAGIQFESLSAQQTGVDFSNDLDPNGPLNMIEYLYFNNGGGVAAGASTGKCMAPRQRQMQDGGVGGRTAGLVQRLRFSAGVRRAALRCAGHSSCVFELGACIVPAPSYATESSRKKTHRVLEKRYRVGPQNKSPNVRLG